jgi:spore maturation protein CgeB
MEGVTVMRILVVHPGPGFSVADVHNGWVEALRELGCDVASFNLDDRLLFYSQALLDTHEKDETGHPIIRQAMDQGQAFTMAIQGLTHACYTFWPDLVIVISAFFVQAGILEVMRSRKHKIVIINTESPYQEDQQLARAPYADLNVLNDPVSLPLYDAAGLNAVYLPHCYRPSVHYPRTGPVKGNLAADLAFVGTGFASRIEFFEAMDLEGLDILLAGNWADLAEGSPLRPHIAHDPGECCDNTETAEVYRNAKTGINFYRRETSDGGTAAGHAMGPREAEMAACGLFFLREPREEGDRVLPMLPQFSGPADAGEQLRWWLAHDGMRSEVALKARAAIADRTFASNAKRLLALLEY